MHGDKPRRVQVTSHQVSWKGFFHGFIHVPDCHAAALIENENGDLIKVSLDFNSLRFLDPLDPIEGV